MPNTLVKNRFIRLFWVFFEKFGLVFLSIISFLIYAKYLTPTQLGIGVLLLTVVEFISKFLIAVVDSSMIRLDAITQEQDGTAFWTLLLVSGIFSVLIFLAYYAYFDENIVILAGLVAVFLIPLQSASRVHIVHLRRKKKFRSLANRTILGKIVGMIVGITLAVKGYGEFAIVSQAVAMAFSSTLLLLIIEKRSLPFSFEKDWLHEQLRIGIPASLKVLNTSLYTKGTILIIEGTLGTAAVGFYNFANRLVELPRSAIVTALMGYANPVYSQRFHAGHDLKEFFLQSTKLGLIFIAPFFVGLAAVADELLFILFGDKWAPSTPILIGIALLTVINLYFLFLPSVLVAYGKTKFALRGQLVSTAVALICLYFLAPKLGLLAVIVALALRVIGLSLANLTAVDRIYPNSFTALFKVLFPSSFASFLMFLVIYFGKPYITFTQSSLLNLLTLIIVGAFIYTVAILLMESKLIRQLKGFISS
uniref:oligosaccharide flippase family protein n=1 Tax=Ningiella ruwaisensis TaxID=2364274 RepID=UPI00109FBC28|nr:oligosaccharide flippase family protein [Ningiella ruwaisensis]